MQEMRDRDVIHLNSIQAVIQLISDIFPHCQITRFHCPVTLFRGIVNAYLPTKCPEHQLINTLQDTGSSMIMKTDQ